MRDYPWLDYFEPLSGPGSGIYRSTDGGATWTRAGGQWLAARTAGTYRARRHSHTARGRASTRRWHSEDDGGVWRSDDGGDHWRRVNADARYLRQLVLLAPDGGSAQSRRRLLGTASRSAARATAARPGRSSRARRAATTTTSCGSIREHPDHWITASDQGAVVTVDDGKTWSSWYNQPTGQFYHVATDNRFPYWIYSGQQDSGTIGTASRSDYGALTFRDWHPVGGDERDYMLPDPDDPDLVFGSGMGGRVSRYDASTGQVANVTPWPINTYGARPTSGEVPLRLGDADGVHAAPSPTRCCSARRCSSAPRTKAITGRSSRPISPASRRMPAAATGRSWRGEQAQGLRLRCDQRHRALAAAARTSSGWVPTAASSSSRVMAARLAECDAAGAEALGEGERDRCLGPRSGALPTRRWTITVRTTSGRTSCAPMTTARPGRKSTPGCRPGEFVPVVRADTVRSGLLYAGTSRGVYVSLDDGDHWQSLQLNLPRAQVNDLLIHGDDLIAATQGRAIWVLDDVTPLRQLSSRHARRAGASVRAGGRLAGSPRTTTRTRRCRPRRPEGQNPPAGAVIDYWLGKGAQGPVTLEIYSFTGQLVRRFSSAEAPAPSRRTGTSTSSGCGRPSGSRPRRECTASLWNLRYARPQAISYEYSIAAVYRRGHADGHRGAFRAARHLQRRADCRWPAIPGASRGAARSAHAHERRRPARAARLQPVACARRSSARDTLYQAEKPAHDQLEALAAAAGCAARGPRAAARGREVA